ncbi:putative E3 ubiquitin-protein ligase dtx2 [Linnemannia gamsii]|uniref:Anaphase-promoting complex subunit 11 n=1 Tax=Linnemannia gamsii TaxID=64522 RepID=A0ABQ7KBH6_9FUNG|nr:putative E3 ubiquitin-protein ligase dtx2 [Linnemannia gamsii]
MSTNSNRGELSEKFKEFFEGCSPEFEQANAIPYDTTMPQFTGTAYPHLRPDASYGLDPQTLLLNITPGTHPDLCSLIASDFLSHTRVPADYSITSMRVLRNPLIWARYQAEKQLRRQLAANRKEAVARERAKGTNNVHVQPPSAANEEDPEELYRDEIVYHGTHQIRVPAILINGLEPRMTVRANYGQGVYFSDSIEKCMQYVDYQASMEQEYCIILCCVLLGRVMVEPHEKSKRNMSPQIKFLPPAFDSAVEYDIYKEWVIIEKSQILPLCVINFKTANHADSYHRLGSFQSIFKGTGHYPNSITEIQKVCNVLVPFDNNSVVNTRAVAENLRDPETHEDDMLFNIFGIPHHKAKVRNLFIGGLREWVFVVPDANGATVMFFVTEYEYTQLVSASKNIQVLRNRLDEDRVRSLNSQSIQAFSIESEIRLIPNGAALVDLITAKLPEIQQVESQGHEVVTLINKLTADAVQAGGQQFLTSPQFLQVLHPHQAKRADLEAKYESLKSLFTGWTTHQFGMGKRVVEVLRPTLAKDIQENNARAERQAAAIEAERERTHNQGRMMIKTLSEQQVQEKLERSKADRAHADRLGHREEFVMKPIEVDTSRTRTWPLIVAELLMPWVMINQLRPEAMKHLNDTNWVNQDHRIRSVLGLPHAKVWWDVAPEVVFGGPTPHHSFWPLDPRKRLPNPTFFWFKDYLEWILKEKESRLRRFNQRHGATGAAALSSGPSQETAIQDQWDHVDPRLVQATRQLSSRFGLDGVSSISSSSSSEKAECPICQDELVIPGSRTTAATTAGTPETDPDKVVKLKSCRHCYHETCIGEWFRSKDAQLKCPMCNVMCTSGAKSGAAKKALLGPQKLGPMPDGALGYFFDVRLCCYFIYIVMPTHTIPEPTTTNPNATKTIPTDIRYAVVPFTSRLGPLLMMRILTLFYYGHLFKVGQSLTRGVNNVVVWNGVHLRTSMSGHYGFPAPNWEINCWTEINQKGVGMGLDEIVLGVPTADGRITHTGSAVAAQAAAAGVALPEALAAEMAAEELTQQLFHHDQPPLFLL